MRYTAFLILFLLALRPALAGDNWPQFRGPTGDGIADTKGLPITWSENENIRWKTPIHDKGWSSPVIWGDQIWLTTARADGHAFYVLCVDRKSGKIIHDIKLFDVPNPAFCIEKNSYASPTPVVEEGRVYLHFGAYGTFCLDSATAKVLWERRDLKCDHFRGPGSSPIIFGNLIILTFDGYDQDYLAALDKTSGKTVWRKDRNIAYQSDNGDYHKAYSTPSVMMVDGKPQLVSPSAECTIAYDPQTGNELWRIHYGGKNSMNAACKPVFGHGLVFLTSGHDRILLAVRQGDSGMLSPENVAWKVSKNIVPTRPSLLLVNDLLFLVSDDGVASCLDAATGKMYWSERLNAPFSASPIYAEGRIYAADEIGKVYVLAADKSFKLLATNKLDDGCMASPAAVGDALYLRTKTHLYCIGTK
ncbi:MAG TPA: PQQ-binding-like beta-propeller repeat protein [Gemmataceae bacterium]|nr:PQQ-binding-like beta-propeller repeat protein [Gemmataceae bacterium]